MSLTTGEIRLVVYGHPAPQGSKKHVGKGVMVESSKYVKPWREDVRASAEAWIAPRRPWVSLDEALLVRMVFSFARPRSHYRTGRNAHLLRDGAPARPHGIPDVSKLARSTEDALTSAGIWRDDARVVDYGRLAKVYVGEDPEALDAPGVVITVDRIARALAVAA
jgi:crossover junction endodeoxyribonuclease RusA